MPNQAFSARLLLLLCFFCIAKLGDSKDVYIKPQKGCLTSCTGTFDDPYDSIWRAFLSSSIGDPDLNFYLLHSYDDKHYMFITEDSEDTSYQTEV